MLALAAALVLPGPDPALLAAAYRAARKQAEAGKPLDAIETLAGARGRSLELARSVPEACRTAQAEVDLAMAEEAIGAKGGIARLLAAARQYPGCDHDNLVDGEGHAAAPLPLIVALRKLDAGEVSGDEIVETLSILSPRVIRGWEWSTPATMPYLTELHRRLPAARFEDACRAALGRKEVRGDQVVLKALAQSRAERGDRKGAVEDVLARLDTLGPVELDEGYEMHRAPRFFLLQEAADWARESGDAALTKRVATALHAELLAMKAGPRLMERSALHWFAGADDDATLARLEREILAGKKVTGAGGAIPAPGASLFSTPETSR